MLRSSDRILTTHAGALPRSERLRGLVMARSQGEPHGPAALGSGQERHRPVDTADAALVSPPPGDDDGGSRRSPGGDGSGRLARCPLGDGLFARRAGSPPRCRRGDPGARHLAR